MCNFDHSLQSLSLIAPLELESPVEDKHGLK